MTDHLPIAAYITVILGLIALVAAYIVAVLTL